MWGQKWNNSSPNEQIQQKEYQSFKKRQGGKLIHWEFCQRFKFDHSDKCYMHKPESLLENKTHKILWDFEI